MQFVDIFGHTFISRVFTEDVFGCIFKVLFEVEIFTYGLEYFVFGIID